MDKQIKDILDLCQEKNISLSELKKELTILEKHDEVKTVENKLLENSELVGKYFKGVVKDTTQYFKVITAYSENELKVECLIFLEYPEPIYSKRISISQGHFLFGKTDLKTFHMESVSIQFLKQLNEISSDEYWLEAKKHFNRLRLLEWDNIIGD